MKSVFRTDLAAWLWIACLQFFVVQILVAAQWHTAFHLTSNYISDLGAMRCGYYPNKTLNYVCSPWHDAMNASMMVQGLLIAGGAVLRPMSAPPGWLRSSLRIIFVLAAIGSMLVGFFPEDISPHLHYFGAAVHLLTANIALLLLGYCISREVPKAIPLHVLLIIFGIAGLVATFLLPLGFYGGLGVGTIERIAVYPLPFCLSLCGISTLFLSREKQTTPA